MSESVPHKAWEEDKEILVPFMSCIVQTCVGKDLVQVVNKNSYDSGLNKTGLFLSDVKVEREIVQSCVVAVLPEQVFYLKKLRKSRLYLAALPCMVSVPMVTLQSKMKSPSSAIIPAFQPNCRRKGKIIKRQGHKSAVSWRTFPQLPQALSHRPELGQMDTPRCKEDC